MRANCELNWVTAPEPVGGRIERRAEQRQRRPHLVVGLVAFGRRALVLLGLGAEQPHHEGHAEDAQRGEPVHVRLGDVGREHVERDPDLAERDADDRPAERCTPHA
jgi:hypothetical protein